jgi:hypothetical protein
VIPTPPPFAAPLPFFLLAVWTPNVAKTPVKTEAMKVGSRSCLGILVWSGGILTLAYVDLPPALQIPKQDLDPTFIASVFTGVLATFGVQTANKKNGNGAANGGGVGITKADMEKLIEAAKSSGPVQTIKVEQAPLKITTEKPTEEKFTL